MELAWGLQDVFGKSPRKSMVELENHLKAKISLGLRMIETADSYMSGDAEKLLGRVGHTTKGLAIATKVGGYRNSLPRPLNNLWVESKLIQKSRILLHGSYYDFNPRVVPESLEKHLTGSLKRLRRAELDIYLLHGLPTHINLDHFIASLNKLKDKGLVKSIGISLEKKCDLDLSWCDIIELPLQLFEKGLHHNGKFIIRSLHRPGINKKLQVSELVKNKTKGYLLSGTQNESHFYELASALKNSST
jgi:aryl-alcohol dehydrogenase-like predicted oxidoreductase